MRERVQDLNDLLKLALDRSSESRAALIAALGDLFSETGAALTERERALMTEILRKLIHDCEMAVRRVVSERLAKAPDPPHDLLLTLANDQIEVAEPVLRQAGILRDVELIEIVRHRTQQHQLAIAVRRSLSEQVADALVETGDGDVVKTLLENRDARISEATMAYLAEESRRVDTYQEPLVKRKDLSPALAERIYQWTSAALRAYILDHFDVHPTDLDDQLEGVARALSRDPKEHRQGPEAKDPAGVLAQHLTGRGEITPELLVQVLRQGEIALFEALFGELVGLKGPRLRRILYDPGGEGLTVACRALELPKPSFATIFLLSRRAQTAGRVLDPRKLSQALILFDRVDSKSALEVLKHWRRDSEYLDAIERIAEASKRPQGDSE